MRHLVSPAMAALALSATVLTACGDTGVAPLGSTSTTISPSPPTTSPTVTTPSVTSAALPADTPFFEERRFDRDGLESVYYLVTPAAYAGTEEIPVTLMLHGGSMTARQLLDTSDYPPVADQQECMLVFPETTTVSGIEALLDDLGDDLSFDASRVYAQGVSAGGLVASRVACELSDRIAAIGTGAGFGLPDPILCERPPRPVPVTSFIDPDDPYFSLPEVTEDLSQWAEWNGCGPEPATAALSADVDVMRWTACDEDATVELYVVNGLGHRWAAPRCLQGTENLCAERSDFDAGAIQWAFFVEHPMP